MRSQSTTLVFPALLIRLLLATSLQMTSTMPAEVDDEREFDYIVGGERGPRKWGENKEEWEACGKGEMQSPVDLSSERVRVITKTEDIERSYKPGNASVKNRGHDIRLRWDKESAGSIKINGTDYSLQQCHWHSPSEHTINGIRYALELHMVHTSSQPNTTNNTAVVGLFYKTGDPDPFLDELLGRIMSNITGGDKHEEREVGVIDPREIKMGGRSYFKYLGSLTVPPCTEGVVWIINKEIEDLMNIMFNLLSISNVSTNQVKLLRETVGDDAEKNARPIQVLNGREFYLNQPHQARTSI